MNTPQYSPPMRLQASIRSSEECRRELSLHSLRAEHASISPGGETHDLCNHKRGA